MERLKISNTDEVKVLSFYLDVAKKSLGIGLQRTVQTTPPTVHNWSVSISRNTFDGMTPTEKAELRQMMVKMLRLAMSYGKHESGEPLTGTIESI